MATPTFTKSGTKATTAAKLSKDVFAVEVTNHELLKQAYDGYLANGRVATATTLKRGEVRGGGRKPWRQKGTGRARAGSTRSPIWRGGGITFGPSGNENFSKDLPKKAKKLAIRQALSLKAAEGQVSVIDSIETTGKTKEIAKLIEKLGLKRRVLLVDEQPSAELRRAASNVAQTEVMAAAYLNVYMILNADNVVLTKKAVAAIETWLGGKA